MGYNKYNAIKTVVDGVRFDSKKEAIRYTGLKALEKSGRIDSLELQRRFELQPGYTTKDGRKVRPIYYIADFVYADDTGLVCEDVKGCRTPIYKLKRKMFEHKYPHIRFVES